MAILLCYWLSVKFQWLGLQDFQLIYEQQCESVHWAPNKEEVWGVEHPFVITLGKRQRSEDFIAQSRFQSPSENINMNVVQTDRGGLTTLHSPGQLVIYPLISLAEREWGAKKYVCNLLKTTQSCLNNLGLNTQIDESSTGLFVDQKKLCFVGLRVSGGRAYHGLSINISNDLGLFDNISACGWKGRPITSLMALGGHPITPQQVFSLWQNSALDQGLFVL